MKSQLRQVLQATLISDDFDFDQLRHRASESDTFYIFGFKLSIISVPDKDSFTARIVQTDVSKIDLK